MAEETKDSTMIPVLGGDRPVSPLPRTPGRPGSPPPLQHYTKEPAPRFAMYRDPGHLRQEMKTIGTHHKRAYSNMYDIRYQRHFTKRFPMDNYRNLWFTEGDYESASEIDDY